MPCGQDRREAGPQVWVRGHTAGLRGHKEEPGRAGGTSGLSGEQVMLVCPGAGSRHFPAGGRERREHGQGWGEGRFLCSPLGPRAPTTPNPRTPTWDSLSRVWRSPGSSETETTQKKRELQETSHAPQFRSCSESSQGRLEARKQGRGHRAQPQGRACAWGRGKEEAGAGMSVAAGRPLAQLRPW